MTSKRNRAVNFVPKEVRLLVDTCIKYANIIENKRTDAVTWKQKNECWEKITAEFNASTESVHRDTKTLRLKYECAKRQLKNKKSKNKFESYKTGGGTPNLIPYLDYEERLLEIISLSVEGLPFTGDSDASDVLNLPGTGM